MDFLLSRYRNLSVLLLMILAQLVLLAYQVKSGSDVRLIRVWAVSAVTPMARVLEFIREHTIGVAENWFVLGNVRDENQKMKEELGRLKIENQFLKTELATADRAQALAKFQQRTPSRTIPARIIGTGTGTNARVVFIDRGSGDGIMRGMAVITPDGIVGKVLASYPTASQVLLITDQMFAAGVISDKNRVHGTVRGQGQSKVRVDHVQNEEKVEPGEIFYTSGDDRIFPKGMPVGKVAVARPGPDGFKEIFLVPSGFQQGLEEVLVVIAGVHGDIPEPKQMSSATSDIYLQPPVEAPKPAAGAAGSPPSATATLTTEADRIREKYKKLGEEQGVKYGEGGKLPNFNAPPASQANPATKPVPQQPGTAPTGAASTGGTPPGAPVQQRQEPRPAGTVPVQPRPVQPKPQPPPPSPQ